MAPYHHMLAHFPVALLFVALLIILARSAVDTELTRRFDQVLPYFLVLGLAAGVATLVSGLLVWQLDAALTSPMGRNKILISTWTMACWAVVALLRVRGGPGVWSGGGRLPLLALAGMGGLLLATTGTLGGHLLGSPSRLSGILRGLGWDVYHTYYAPTWVLAVLAGAAVVSVAVGLFSAREGNRRHSAPPVTTDHVMASETERDIEKVTA